MEEFIYKNGRIEITKSLARINEVSYPIANIGSVTTQDSDPSALLGLGGLLIIVGIIVSFNGKAGGGVPLAVIGLILAFLGSRRQKRKLILKTSSGDQMALQGTATLVDEVRVAIEKAVVMRS